MHPFKCRSQKNEHWPHFLIFFLAWLTEQHTRQSAKNTLTDLVCSSCWSSRILDARFSSSLLWATTICCTVSLCVSSISCICRGISASFTDPEQQPALHEVIKRVQVRDPSKTSATKTSSAGDEKYWKTATATVAAMFSYCRKIVKLSASASWLWFPSHCCSGRGKTSVPPDKWKALQVTSNCKLHILSTDKCNQKRHDKFSAVCWLSLVKYSFCSSDFQSSKLWNHG